MMTPLSAKRPAVYGSLSLAQKAFRKPWSFDKYKLSAFLYLSRSFHPNQAGVAWLKNLFDKHILCFMENLKY